jgi:hypothetical protein
MMGKLKETMFGTILGFVATLVVHLFSFLLLGSLLIVFGLLASWLLSGLVTPEFSEGFGIFAVLALPLWIFLFLLGVSSLTYLFEVFLPLAGGLVIVLGLASGGLVGCFYRQARFGKSPYRFSALIGLLVNLMSLIILALLTTSTVFQLLPGYLCLGPLVGLLTVFLMRRILPVVRNLDPSS